MKTVIVGLGIQGKKRLEIAGKDCVATVDPFKKEATYQELSAIPLTTYDAALICTPDDQKIPLIEYLLKHKKHILIEKPILTTNDHVLRRLKNLAEEQNVTVYTAYNHRFEPHFITIREHLKDLGKIYTCRLFYGNGTARDVRNSEWKDKESGALTDLGSHLLNTLFFWFGKQAYDFKMVKGHTFENKSLDHLMMVSAGDIFFNLEMTYLSWRNHFSCDIIGENGSCHIDSLCKWGPSTFIKRTRKLPSGRPDEVSQTLIQSDPTWKAEYDHFKKLCHLGKNNLDDEILLNDIFNHLMQEVLC